MLVRQAIQQTVEHLNERRLFLNGKEAGRVVLLSHDGPWRFGRFEPAEGFAEFAPVFGRWSLVMHAEDDDRRLSREASVELRETENAIDRIHAKLCVAGRPTVEVRGLNIDGTMIEWLEG